MVMLFEQVYKSRLCGLHLYPHALSATKVITLLLDFSMIALHSTIGLPFVLFEKIAGLDYRADTSKPVAILIHGTGIDSIQWGVAKLYLWTKGIPWYCVNYNHSQRILQSKEDVLAECKKELVLESRKHRKVFLIGHSQGGIIARLLHSQCREDPSLGLDVQKTFLLHAPQKGALIIKLKEKVFGYSSLKPCLQDMNFGSHFLKCHYSRACTTREDIFETAGIGDYVDPQLALCRFEHAYVSWLGHYFPAVNSYLWYSFIIPNLSSQ
jgi:pimeloyl-ACP methyl ester carboxylesterase